MPRRARTSGTEARATEAHWPASLAVIAALALYVTLPDRLIVGPRWVVPALEAALLIPLSLPPRRHYDSEPRWVRWVSIALVALVNAANIASLVLLANVLLKGGSGGDLGRQVITSAMQVWLTNVVIFGLWFWEIDRGGPGARTRAKPKLPDFLFPQTTQPTIAPSGWRPHFGDYLYISFTNATAFSPTDTMPLTLSAKALMGVQSLASLLTVALVAARAVNILS